MRTGLQPSDLGDLLGRPLNAVVATYLRAGEVSLTPVWHLWDGERFILQFPAGDRKIDRIRRDPRIAVLVAENEHPYRAIEVRGSAEISVDDYHEVGRSVNRRYIQAYDPTADEMAYLSRDPGVIVRVQAQRVRAWDYADDDLMPPT
jgi:PPOX class probable F420-dependent enzyme